MSDLQQLRSIIDKCDMEIVQAIEKRFNTVKEIVQYKKTNKLEIFQPNREREVLEKVNSYLKTNEFNKELQSIYILIMDISKEIQEKH